VHPYMAQGVAKERVADLIRAAEANHKAREGAERGSRPRHGLRRRRPAHPQPGLTAPKLVANPHPIGVVDDQDRSAELCGAVR
jgi:hypothetical protein